MNEHTRDSIRRIFINPRPHVALMTAANLLRMPFPILKHEIAEGTIVAVSVGMVGLRVPQEEMIAAAMRIWPQAEIEEALGEAARWALPEAIRLVELRARVPRYQRDMLQFLARKNETTVDEVLTRELEDVACAHAEELAAAVPGFAEALAWPEQAEG
jgi:endonuclease/exonuclease/phosphatase (EEP) superfamily protein YafD